MATAVSKRFDRWLARFPYWTSAIAVLVGLAALVGWTFDLPALKSVVPGVVSMKANTALAFVLAGFSLLFLKAIRPNRWTRTLTQVFPAIVALLGLLTLSEYLFGWNLGIDQMLFREPPGTVGTSDPGRMAPSTALNFSLLGFALLFPGRKTRLGLSSSEILTIPAIFLAATALIGYAYGAPDITGIGAYTRMAVHTSVVFIALGLGILVAYPSEGLAAIFLADSAGGYMARRLLPIALASAVFLGWVRLAGENQGLYESAAGTALVVLALMTIVSISTLWNARSLNASDEQRGQVEQALRESDERTRELMEHLPVGIGVSSPGGNSVYANSTLLNILGYPSKEEFLKTPVSNLYANPQDRSRFLELLKGGNVKDFEFQYRRIDATLAWGAMDAMMQRNLSGESQIVTVLQDITERKRAEAERAYNTYVLANVGDAVIATDARFVVTSWSGAAERIYGWRAEEALGRPVDELIRSRVSDDERREFRRILWEKGQLEADYIQYRRDGSPIQVSARTVALRAGDGSITGTVTLSRDVTEAQQAERDRDRLFNFSLDMLCIAGFDGYFKQLNPAWEKALGWTNEELMSKPYLDFVHPEDRQPTIDAAGGLAEGTTVITFENRYRCKDGSYRWISWNSYPLMEEKLIFAAARDITERNNAEEQIARQAKELTRSNAELEQFAYVASHDLQEPLRMVASYTELIAKRYKGKLDAEADEFISYAVDGANRMRALINDLLVYSRMGTGGKEFAPTSMQTVLDVALSNLQVAIRESGAEITHNAMPTVMADGSQLVQVLQNLIGNAITFRRESPPRVHIAAERRGDEWVLSVRDNGIGIDSKYFHRLFTMFQRLHARNEYPGTGIGLAIVKKIVERHLGRVWVESQPGQGSTFYFTIPAKEV